MKARPTVYKGIQMRSRLEAQYAAFLDRMGANWDYEPMCFASPAGQYLPDFGLSSRYPGKPKKRTRYVEVKPLVKDPLPIIRRMEIIWASEPDVQLELVEFKMGGRIWATHFFGEQDWDCTPGPDDLWAPILADHGSSPAASARLALGGIRKPPPTTEAP